MEVRCAHCLQLLQIVDGEVVRCSAHPFGALEAKEEIPNTIQSTENSNGFS